MSIEVFLDERQRHLASEIRAWVEDHLYSDPGDETDPDGEGLRLLGKMRASGHLP